MPTRLLSYCLVYCSLACFSAGKIPKNQIVLILYCFFSTILALIPTYLSVLYGDSRHDNSYEYLRLHLEKTGLWRDTQSQALIRCHTLYAAFDQCLDFLSHMSICREHFSRFLHNLKTIYEYEISWFIQKFRGKI